MKILLCSDTPDSLRLARMTQEHEILSWVRGEPERGAIRGFMQGVVAKPDLAIFDAPGFERESQIVRKRGIPTVGGTLFAPVIEGQAGTELVVKALGAVPDGSDLFAVWAWYSRGHMVEPCWASIDRDHVIEGALGSEAKCRSSVVWCWISSGQRAVVETHGAVADAIAGEEYDGLLGMEVKLVDGSLRFSRFRARFPYDAILGWGSLLAADPFDVIAGVERGIREYEAERFNHSVTIDIGQFLSLQVSRNWQDALRKTRKEIAAGEQGSLIRELQRGGIFDEPRVEPREAAQEPAGRAVAS